MSDIDPEFDFPIEEILPATAEPVSPLQQLSGSLRQVFSAYPPVIIIRPLLPLLECCSN